MKAELVFLSIQSVVLLAMLSILDNVFPYSSNIWSFL